MNLQTKADFTALMHKFLDPLKPYYSAGCARLHLGETGVTYDRNAIELEAFSRPLWALVPFWVGGGSDPEFETIYRKGLAAGADPESPEYWGTTGAYSKKSPYNTCTPEGVDECTSWGDYFYMEALTRLTKDWEMYW